jgi:uncharacterized cupredoxin-like copper-binding protein
MIGKIFPVLIALVLVVGCTSTIEEQVKSTDRPVKEFEMESFYTIEDGKPHPQFSVKEMSVKKGDLVRIKVTNTKGSHDFKLDEFNVFSETPLNETVTIEFVADKAGEFVYYCSKPGHREGGHFGTLKVEE